MNWSVHLWVTHSHHTRRKISHFTSFYIFVQIYVLSLNALIYKNLYYNKSFINCKKSTCINYLSVIYLFYKFLCGYSLVVECYASDLMAWVRFPLPAPFKINLRTSSLAKFYFHFFQNL